MQTDTETDTFIHIHDAALLVLADIAPLVLRVTAAGLGGGDTRRRLVIPVELGKGDPQE